MKFYDSMGFESPDGIWARRADVVDIEYSIKLQRLIENLKYDTETPYPELHHHKMIVAAKTRIRELEAALLGAEGLLDAIELIAVNDKSGCTACTAIVNAIVTERNTVTADREGEHP